MRVTTESRVHKLVEEHLGVPAEKVVPEALLVPDNDGHGRLVKSDRPDLGADSLDVIELVMGTEDEFGIEIFDEETERLQSGTVKDLADLVTAKLAAKAA
jgi:acyl carrier protein